MPTAWPTWHRLSACRFLTKSQFFLDSCGLSPVWRLFAFMTLLPVTRVPPVSWVDGGGVDCLSEAFDDCVDLRRVNDERRRNQDMVAACAIQRAAHRVDH